MDSKNNSNFQMSAPSMWRYAVNDERFHPYLPPPTSSNHQQIEANTMFNGSDSCMGRSPPKRRRNVNLKERRRNLAINDAFNQLQKLIPFVPEQSRLPKIKTLRLAVSYIGHLNQLLADSDGAVSSSTTDTPTSDFAHVVAAEIQTRNAYKQRAESWLQESGAKTSIKEERIPCCSSEAVPAISNHTWPQCSCCPF